MPRFRSRRINHTTVVAYLALFVALGGSSYAAVRIGSKQIVDNSIRSKDIRNGKVTSRDIKNNDVRSVDVRNGSLLARDFMAGQLPAGATGPKGATGGRGAQGLPGNDGSDGADGVSGYEDVRTALIDQPLEPNSFTIKSVSCPVGKVATGGGVDILSTNATFAKFIVIQLSARSASDPRTWQVAVRNADTVARTARIVVSAECVTVLP